MTIADIIPPKFRDRVRSIARVRQISVEAVVEEALGEYVQTHQVPASSNSSSSTEVIGESLSRSKISMNDPLPVFGDPTKKLSWEEVKPMIEQQDYEDDLRSLGMSDDAAPRR